MENNKPPSEEATYDRAIRLANYWLYSISLQHRRIKSVEPEDKNFVFREWADYDFLIVALTRFRRAVKIPTGVISIKQELEKAIEEFDKALPDLKTMRDLAEHIDDYAVDQGRNQKISRKMLEVSTLNDTELNWLGSKLDVDEALKASEKLYEVLKEIQQRI